MCCIRIHYLFASLKCHLHKINKKKTKLNLFGYVVSLLEKVLSLLVQGKNEGKYKLIGAE